MPKLTMINVQYFFFRIQCKIFYWLGKALYMGLIARLSPFMQTGICTDKFYTVCDKYAA